MTILRTIICNKCGARYTEQGPNMGFPGWGHIAGIQNAETGETTAHLCPSCLSKAKTFLNEAPK
jgi:hypothetical protein